MQPEEDIREDFCLTLRLIAHWGLDDLIFSHVGLRLNDDEILVNPLNRLFFRIKPHELIKINNSGDIIDSPANLKPTGTKIVRSILSSRKDIGCVIHTHSKNAITIASQSDRLFRLCQQALIIGPTHIHPYGDPTVGPEEASTIVKSLGSDNNLILEHHGLITTGRFLKDTLLRLYFFEYAADLHVRSLATQNPPRELEKDSSFTPVLDNQELVDSTWDALKTHFGPLL